MPSTCARISSASRRGCSMPRSASTSAALRERSSAVSDTESGLTGGCGVGRSGGRRLEVLGLARELQRLDQLLQVAIQDLVQPVERQTDAVIGDASLGEIVGAD